MKKAVLKLDINDEKCKQKVMKSVSSLSGVESISIDLKDRKLTVTGNADPVEIVSKLKKVCFTQILSVGPAKEEPKKAEPAKKECKCSTVHMNMTPSHCSYPTYVVRSAEEDPNARVIC